MSRAEEKRFERGCIFLHLVLGQIIVSDGIVWTVLVGTLNSALGDTLKCFKNSSKSAKTEEQMHHAL